MSIGTVSDLAKEMRTYGVTRVTFDYGPDGEQRITSCEVGPNPVAPTDPPPPLTAEEMILAREQREKDEAALRAELDQLQFAAVEGFPR